MGETRREFARPEHHPDCAPTPNDRALPGEHRRKCKHAVDLRIRRKLAFRPLLVRRYETEARVVFGMTEHDHGVEASSSARLQTFVHQCRTDTLPLERRRN